jgi:hypothetical protein
MNVERISDTMFTIDGQLVELHQGDLEFSNGEEMSFYQYRAVCEFIEIEEQNLRILARRMVIRLLAELGIKREK